MHPSYNLQPKIPKAIVMLPLLILMVAVLAVITPLTFIRRRWLLLSFLAGWILAAILWPPNAIALVIAATLVGLCILAYVLYMVVLYEA